MHKLSPSDEATIKVNVDISIVSEAIIFTIGMVIRDHSGVFQEGKNLKLSCPATGF